MFNIFQDAGEVEKAFMRHRARNLFSLLILLAAVLIASYGVMVWRDVKGILEQEKLQIVVSGEGKVTAKPDVARVTATILTEKESLQEAQAENSRKSQAVTEYLKRQGVAEKDIRTTGYNISPQYSYPSPCPPYGVCPLEERRPKIIGYQVRNSYEVTIRDLAKAGAVLAGVVSAGANEVYGISFTIDDPDALKAEARKAAIAEAREKAKVLASDLGMRIGRVANFSEGGSFPPPVFFGREMALDGKGGGGDFEPSVQPGENEIIVIVSVTYEFK